MQNSMQHAMSFGLKWSFSIFYRRPDKMEKVCLPWSDGKRSNAGTNGMPLHDSKGVAICTETHLSRLKSCFS